MTFGAMAAWQAWLLLGAAGAVAAGLFLLKLRPPRSIVPSLLLWRRVLDEARELTLWERIRRAVSLVATVLIALAIALALTRPRAAEGKADVSGGRLLIVLDSSWSMQARTNSGESRWDRAVAEARRLVSAASGGHVALATTAEGVIEGPTTDAALIDAALDRTRPSGADSTAPWPRLAGAAVHFITDGAGARPLDEDVIVHSVFEPASNAAITAFDARPALVPGTAGDAYLEISNFAPAAQSIRLTLRRGTATIFDRELNAGPFEALRQVIPISAGGSPSLRATIRAAHNALAADDEAVLWVDGAQPLTVVVVGNDIEWLRTAFSRDPGIRAVFIAPADYPSDADLRNLQADAFVFDRWAPREMPRRPSLLFAPPLDTPWLSGGSPDRVPGVPGPGQEERRPRWEVPGIHRVVQGVDPFTLTLERARRYDTALLEPVARSARGTPLVSVHESANARCVVVGFSTDDSNLANAPGFPVLIGNALEWLARPASASARRPGLIALEDAVTRVTGPDGAEVPLTRMNRSAVALLATPGLYVAEGGGARSRIAVNAGDPQLSNLTRTTADGSGRGITVTPGSSGRPWWLYCAALAFTLALVEWWTWQRRITV